MGTASRLSVRALVSVATFTNGIVEVRGRESVFRGPCGSLRTPLIRYVGKNQL